MADLLHLDGQTLTIAALARAAATPCKITLCPQGLERMAASRAVVMRAIAQDLPVYGVTTGLGARSTERLSHAQLSEFSLETIRGRAHAVGQPESMATVRAAMIVRLNTLLSGCSGASPALADHVLACLNAGLTPIVPTIGSVGVADLTWNATLALGLIGEAPLTGPSGTLGHGADMLRASGIAPWLPGPRDGLAIVSHSCGVVARAAGAMFDARRAFEVTQTAAALSMLAFQASLTPFRADVLACGGHSSQEIAANGIRQRLSGSALMMGVAPRRLQDPLSIRNIPQIHGAVMAALEFGENTVQIDLNGCSDNPIVLTDRDEVVSCGAYFTANLTSALEMVARAFVQMATAQVARMSKLLTPDFSGLPLFLAAHGATSNGFAPILKTAEALLAEVLHEAQPVSVWPSISANGVEDVLTSSPVAARSLARIAGLSLRLSAAELIIAAQGVDLRGDAARPGPMLAGCMTMIRAISAPLTTARPLGTEIEQLADRLAAFELSPALLGAVLSD